MTRVNGQEARSLPSLFVAYRLPQFTFMCKNLCDYTVQGMCTPHAREVGAIILFTKNSFGTINWHFPFHTITFHF